MPTIKDIATEATGLADQHAVNYNVAIKKELVPLYQSIGGLAKAVDEHAGNTNASLRDLTARVEELERSAITKAHSSRAAAWRRFVEWLKSDVSFVS